MTITNLFSNNRIRQKVLISRQVATTMTHEQPYMHERGFARDILDEFVFSIPRKCLLPLFKVV